MNAASRPPEATPVRARPPAWPARALTWVVPFNAGGVTDLVARAVAQALGQRLGQPVVIDLRPGMAGSLGTEWVARHPADGHTLLYISTGPMAVNPWLYRLRYEPLRDFVPVHGLLQSSPVLAVRADAPWPDLGALVAAAQARPGALNVGSSAPGTSTHLAGVLFAREAGLRLEHVPYKGAAAALQDLLGGHVHAVFDYLLPLRPQVEAGAVRVLAVMGPQRLAALPGVPTIGEAGYPGARGASWSGLAVRTGTDTAVVQRLEAAMQDVMTDPEVVSPFLATGEIPLVEMRSAPFRAFIEAERLRWGEVVRRAGLA